MVEADTEEVFPRKLVRGATALSRKVTLLSQEPLPSYSSVAQKKAMGKEAQRSLPPILRAGSIARAL